MRDDRCDPERTWDRQSHPALYVLRFERLFNHTVTRSAGGNRQVSLVLEFVNAQGVADSGMIPAQHTNKPFLEKSLLAEASSHRQDESYGQIRLTGFEELGGGFRKSSQIDSNAGGNLPQALHEARHQGDLRDIARIQVEPPIRSQRIEYHMKIEGGLQDVFCILQQTNELHCVRRGIHAGRCPNEQRIVKMLTQLGQTHADGRLAQVEVLGRLGHASGLM